MNNRKLIAETIKTGLMFLGMILSGFALFFLITADMNSINDAWRIIGFMSVSGACYSLGDLLHRFIMRKSKDEVTA